MKGLLRLARLFGQGSRLDVGVRAERVRLLRQAQNIAYGLNPSPEGALPFQDGGSALCCVRLIILLAIALLPTLAMAAPSLSPAETKLARQDPTVRIEPAQSVVGASETFTITVMIDQADDLGGFEFTLLFVTTMVKVESVAVGDFPGSTGRTVIPVVGPTIDNQAGRASLGVVTVGRAIPGPNGTGALATVTLTAQGSGQSSLDLQDILVVDTTAGPKTPAVEDGMVRVGFAVYLPLILKDW